jgi:hypothetical protein
MWLGHYSLLLLLLLLLTVVVIPRYVACIITDCYLIVAFHYCVNRCRCWNCCDLFIWLLLLLRRCCLYTACCCCFGYRCYCWLLPTLTRCYVTLFVGWLSLLFRCRCVVVVIVVALVFTVVVVVACRLVVRCTLLSLILLRCCVPFGYVCVTVVVFVTLLCRCCCCGYYRGCCRLYSCVVIVPLLVFYGTRCWWCRWCCCCGGWTAPLLLLIALFIHCWRLHYAFYAPIHRCVTFAFAVPLPSCCFATTRCGCVVVLLIVRCVRCWLDVVTCGPVVVSGLCGRYVVGWCWLLLFAVPTVVVTLVGYGLLLLRTLLVTLWPLIWPFRMRTWPLPLRICYGTLPLPFNGPLRCAVTVVLVVLLLRCYVTLLVDRVVAVVVVWLPFDTLPLPALRYVVCAVTLTRWWPTFGGWLVDLPVVLPRYVVAVPYVGTCWFDLVTARFTVGAVCCCCWFGYILIDRVVELPWLLPLLRCVCDYVRADCATLRLIVGALLNGDCCTLLISIDCCVVVDYSWCVGCLHCWR